MTATIWTTAHLAALEASIAMGARRVSYPDGRSVEFGSIDEMLKLRSVMSAAIAGVDQGNQSLIFAGRVS